MKSRIKAVTLVEVLIVAVILAVLASMAVPVYTKAIERAKDKEAENVLKVIMSAEEQYRLKHDVYWDQAFPGVEGDVAHINAGLKLFLKDADWAYTIKYDGAGIIIKAQRSGPPSGWERSWNARVAYDEAYRQEPGCSGSNCPYP